MQFQGLIFDFDGTITPKGVHYPQPEMVARLVNLAQRVPIACCTGRQLESFVEHGMNYFLEGIDPGLKDGFLRNMMLMGENGSVGYYFDPIRGDFEEFYRAEWPESFIPRAELYQRLAEAIKDYGVLYDNAHRVVIVMRTHLNRVPNRDINEVYALSDKIYEVTVKLLEEMDANYEDYLHVGNSGLGVIVCPAKGDKDMGIYQFANFLNGKRGLGFGAEAREILVVGDRPEKSGNDHYLLNGHYGTPYTVGDLLLEAPFPHPVLDDAGERLFHDAGTGFLVDKNFG